MQKLSKGLFIPHKARIKTGSLFIIAMCVAGVALLASCDWLKKPIIGDLSYNDIRVPAGTESTASPQWRGNPNDQYLQYSLSPAVAGISINSETGIIRISSEAKIMEQQFSVSAKGSGRYDGKVDASIKIIITTAESTNLFEYADINAVAGTAFTRAYTLLSDFSDGTTFSNFAITPSDGPTISTAGIVTVNTDIITTGTEYMVTAMATKTVDTELIETIAKSTFTLKVFDENSASLLTEKPEYQVSSANVKVGTVAVVENADGTFSAEVIPGSGLNKIPAPQFSFDDVKKAESIRYSLVQTQSSTSVSSSINNISGTIVSGINIDANSGIITIEENANASISGNYLIYAEAVGEFAGQQSVAIKITITKRIEITDTHTFSYGAANQISLEYNTGSATPYAPTWSDTGATATYEITSANITGISIDGNTGEISIAKNIPRGEYIVTIAASGTNVYFGKVSIDVTVEVVQKSIAGAYTFSYGTNNEITVSTTEPLVISPTWSLSGSIISLPNGIVTYLGPRPVAPTILSEGIILDVDSGNITIEADKLTAQSIIVSVTANGIGDYTGEAVAGITINKAIESKKEITGTFSYGAISTTYGTAKTSNEPVWESVVDTPQTISYSISPEATGITVGIEGAVSVSAIASVAASREYTVTAQGTGFYGGTITTSVAISIAPATIAATLSYGTANSATVQANNTAYTINPTWSSSGITATYALKAGATLPVGVTINGTTGTLTVDGSALADGNSKVIVTATGTGNYTNSIDSAELTITKEKVGIVGTLRYNSGSAASSVYGSGASYAATWEGAPSAQTVAYSISPTTAGISINSEGTITVASTAIEQTAKEYTITATGSGNYVNSKTSTFSIIITSKAIDGTLSYGNKTAIQGSIPVAAYTPAWTVEPTDSNQTYDYSLSINPQTSKVAIDSTTGSITLKNDIAVNSYEVTVTITGTGNYGGSINSIFDLTIHPQLGTLSYGSAGTVTVNSTETQLIVAPAWSVSQDNRSASYVVKNGSTLPTGVVLNATTGALTINGTTAGLDGKSITIVATGTGDYAGQSAEASITISVTIVEIAGTVTYNGGAEASSVYGTEASYAATWEGETTGQTISYNISPTTTGISIDATSGEVTVASTAIVQAVKSYTITATGSGNYGGSKTTALSIVVTAKPIAGSFSYGTGADSFTFATAKSYDVTTQWTDGSQSLEYTLDQTISGISINNASGTITVANTVVAGTHALSITATGTANYTGTLAAGLTLTITKELSTFALSYGSANAVSALATATAYKVSPSWSQASVTATYAVKDGTSVPSGVVLEIDGALTINGSTVTNGATIEITATGTGIYSGNKDVEVSITKTSETIAGTFSYEAISTTFGTSATKNPIWSGATSGQTQAYSLIPVVAGVSIASSTGTITVANNAAITASKEYIVTAQGTRLYGGTITTSVTISIAPATITATLSYGTANNATVQANNTAYTINPTWSSSGITATYVLKAGTTLPAGVTINGTTGTLTVDGSALADGNSKVIVTATGTGNYTNSIDSAELTITKEKVGIVGTLRYNGGSAASSVYGSGASYAATWIGAPSAQTVTYSISPTTAGISINSEGTITVASTAIEQAAKEYTITATGSGNYVNSKTSTFSIIITSKAIDGTLSYGNKTAIQGSIPVAAYTPAWTVEPTDSNQTYDYSLSINPQTSKVAIDSTTGSITLKNDIAVNSYEVTVTITGTGNYGGSINSIFDLTIHPQLGTLSYGSAGTVTVNSTETQLIVAPAWSVSQDNRSASYVVKNGSTLPTGVVLNATTGALTINGTTAGLDGKSITIVATGTGNYAGQSAEANITLSVTIVEIAGTLSYNSGNAASSVYGTEASYAATWEGETTGQTVSYNISPTTAGISIDATSGEVTVASTAIVQAVKSYTITATGSGNYGGSKTTALSIVVTAKPIEGTLAYTAINATYGTAATSVPTWTPLLSEQTVAYSISPTTTGISVDANGKVTVASTAIVQAAKNYTITAAGTGNYTSSTNAVISIAINKKAIAGTLAYTAITATYGTAATSAPTWTPLLSEQTVAYSISPITTGISVDANGKVTVASTAIVQAAKNYTITATGTGNYTSSTNAVISITINQKAIEGTLTYTAINRTYGTVAESNAVWNNPLSGQTIIYSISPTTTGISVDANGKVTVASTTAVQTATSYTITAIGSGNYGGSKTATISIAINKKAIAGTLAYTAITATYGTAATSTPTWTPSLSGQTIIYSISPTTTGISVDANGKVTVASTTAVQTATNYTITATGTGNYGGSKTFPLSITINKKAIAGTLAYTAISATYGTAATSVPTWTPFLSEQTVAYSISPTTTGISVDANGKVTVASTTAVQTATNYTITATGTGNYTSSTNTVISITINQKAIEGTLTYTAINRTYGTVAESNAVWNNPLSGQTIIYSISPTTTGISVDANGKVTVASTTAVQTATNYTITAIGSGNYGGSKTATISIAINKKAIAGTLAYTAITATYGTAATSTPTWTPSLSGQTIIYSISPTTTGISVDANGKVTVASTTAVQTATNYTITATGTGNYGGSKTFPLSITINKKAIAGTLAYTAISATYGTAATSVPTWTPSLSGQTIIYSISPTTTGISIDATSGEVTVGTTVAVQTATSYTITAIGSGNYRGSKTATISIAINKKAIAGTLAYTAISATYGTAATSTPTWTPSLSGQTIIYSISPTTTGISIDATSGEVTVGTTVAVQTATSYTITAIGSGNYGGSKTFPLSITINKKVIAGTLAYTAITATYGTAATSVPTWTPLLSEQTVAYSISPATTGISVDANGKVTVASTAIVQAAKNYTITAAGTGNYTSSTNAVISIAINKKAIAGTLAYTAINKTYGTAATSTPTWTPSLSEQTVAYSISPITTGISVDANGKVTVASTAIVQAAKNYTITAAGTGNYTSSTNAVISITINKKAIEGTLAYTAINKTYGTAATSTPTWTPSLSGQTIIYSISPTTTGISVDANGKVTVASTTAAQTATNYTITAIGSGNYGGSKTFPLSITINKKVIAGTLAYTAISTIYGTVATSTPTWTPSLSEQTVAYSISPITTGISVDANGKVTVASTAIVQAAKNYTITAAGTGNYTSSTNTVISITINQKAIEGTLAYTAINATYGTAATSVPTWTPLLSEQTVAYSISPTTTGISVDANGKVTVASTTAAQTATNYTITAIGSGNYGGSKTGTISIAINKKAIAGTLAYTAISATYGTAATSTPTWTPSLSEQTVAYSISPTTTGISVDANGKVTVASTAIVQTAKNYTITAIGSGNYGGSKTATISIAINKKAIDGILSYGNKTAIQGSIPEVAYTPAWTVAPTDSSQTYEYSLSINPLTNKMLINATKGAISLANDIGVNSYEVTVTITGTGNYGGSIISIFDLTIYPQLGTLSYGSAGTVTVNSTETQFIAEPAWSVSQDNRSASYVVKNGSTLPTGVVLNATTGALTINGTTAGLDGKSVTIVATGTGDYAGQSAEASITISVTIVEIAGTVTYNGGAEASSVYGTEASYAATWEGETTGQTVSYNISPTTTGISIDATSGEVTVASTAIVQAVKSYTITAIGSGNYGGSKTATISIAINKKAIGGTLAYTAINKTYGTAATSTPTWTPSLSGQTIIYSISPTTTGISVDANGKVTVASTAIVQAAKNYTITAAGTGNYTSSTNAVISITINQKAIEGTLAYTAISTIYGTVATSTPTWTPFLSEQTVAYSISPATTGISVDANGKVTVASTTAAQTATNYTITAIGSGNYGGSKTGTISIAINKKAIAGTLAYTAISATYGTAATSTPTWTPSLSGQTIIYSISPTTTGISIDATSGEVTVGTTVAVQTATSYTITAVGTGNYTSSTNAVISITINQKAIEGTLAYTAISTIYGTAATSTPTWTPFLSEQTVAYSISPATTGISVDANGKVTVASTTAAQTAKNYTITAAGTGNYGGSKTFPLSITINKKAITGALSYVINNPVDRTSTSYIEPTWNFSMSRTGITYAVKGTAPNGIGLNTTTGKITIDGSTLAEGDSTLTIEATGTGNYTGTVETAALTITKDKIAIIGTFNYSTVGVLNTSAIGTSVQPQWSGASAGQTVRYEFASSNANPAGISLNTNTGILTVYGNAVTAGNYSIDAISTGIYKGSISGNITVETRNNEITGTFSYAPLNTTYGTQETSNAPTWIGANTNQTLTYSINSDAVSIDATTGVVTISDATPAVTTQFIISATGTGSYGGTKTASIDVIVAPKTISGSFSYATIIATVGSIQTVDVTASIDGSVSYAISPQDNGVSINASSGQVTITPSSAAALKRYSIVATGTGNYTGGLKSTIDITVNGALSGSLSYPTSSIATAIPSITIHPQWEGASEGQTYTYSVTPTANAAINGNTGALTVIAEGSYTVTATGTGLYNGSTITSSEVKIAEVNSRIEGAFSYTQAMTSAYGNSKEHAAPTWTGANINQTQSFTINPNVAGISINANNGAIAASNTAATGTYHFVVTATGIGDYAGNIQGLATVVISAKAIAGTLSYASVNAKVGVPQMASAVWSAISAQTLEYGISPASSGISIDSDTGAITIAPSAVFDTTTYTVTASGKGNYNGTTTGTIDIKTTAALGGTLSYNAINITANTSLQSKAIWTNAPSGQSVDYAFSDSSTPGLILNPTTGTITIDGGNAITGSYSVTAAAVNAGLYEGSTSGSIQITVIPDTDKNITGTLNYEAISAIYGNSTSATPTWDSVLTEGQNVVYSIRPVVAGIEIDSDTGIINVANTANVSASGTYIVSASGIGAYGGLVSASVNISIGTTALQGVLRASSIQTITGTKTTSTSPIWSQTSGTQTVSYSISPEKEQVSIDSTTGIITITDGVEATEYNYTLTATGTNNYSGSIQAQGSIKIQGSIAEGILLYADLPVTSSDTTVVSPTPIWINLGEAGQRSVSYSISGPAHSLWPSITLTPTIDSANGKITATKDTIGIFNIIATGTGLYTGTAYGTINIYAESNTNAIGGTFSYPTSASDTTKLTTIQASYGTVLTTQAPTWSGNVNGQTISYSISPHTTGISIDSSTGVISIDATTNAQVASGYTITAIGTGAFGGVVSSIIAIGVSGSPLTGTFSYTLLSSDYGVAKKSAVPSWTGAPVDQTVKYLLSSSASAGISVDESTGEVYIADTTALRNATDSTIIAVGIGNYDGSVQGTISITVTAKSLAGSIAYDSISHTYGTSKTYAVTKHLFPDGQTGNYTITASSNTVAGVSIDSSGAITIDNTAVVATAQNYTVTLTGNGNYTGTITAVVSITIKAVNIAGIALSYPATVVGGSGAVNVSPSWALSSSDVTYVLDGSPTELSIATDGTITITAASVSAGSYTITASGKDNYTGTQTATLIITKTTTTNALSGTLVYTNLVVAVDSPVLEHNTTSPSGLTGAIGYSIAPQATGISIDNNIGTITVSKDAVITPNSVTYTVTARGKSNATATATLTIHANYAICLLDDTISNGEITNWRQLASIGKDTSTLAGSYTLQNDIVMPNAGQCSDYGSNGWTPIGENEEGVYHSFTGTFNGAEHTISNLYINKSGLTGNDKVGWNAALFAQTLNATITNLVVDHVGITGTDYVGAIAGLASSSTITNVRSQSSANKPIIGTNRVGGLVGFLQNYSFVNPMTVEGSSSALVEGAIEVGGLIGYIENWFGPINLKGYFTGAASSSVSLSNVGYLIGGISSFSNQITIIGYSASTLTGAQPFRPSALIGANKLKDISKMTIEAIVRNPVFSKKGDSLLSYVLSDSDTASSSSSIKLYNSTTETLASSASFVNDHGTIDVAYSSSLSKSAFEETNKVLTFGTDIGTWQWVANGQFPALNVGSLSVIADQPTNLLAVDSFSMADSCEIPLNKPLLEADVYKIRNWKELRWIENCKEADYELTNDIQLPTRGSDTLYGVNGWDPLFKNNEGFTGTFDGKGYTIKDFYMNITDENVYAGLFSQVDVDFSRIPIKQVVIKNLRIDHIGISFVKGAAFVGSLINSGGNSKWQFTNLGLESSTNATIKGLAAATSTTAYTERGFIVGPKSLGTNVTNNNQIRVYNTSNSEGVYGLVYGGLEYATLVGYNTGTITNSEVADFTTNKAAALGFVSIITNYKSKVKGYSISTEIEENSDYSYGSEFYNRHVLKVYTRTSATATEGKTYNIAATNSAFDRPTYPGTTFTMTSTTTLAEFLVANAGFRDANNANALDSDWIWVADGKWPAINLLPENERDTAAADYVAPLVAPADQPIDIQ